jgi:hypothetical protein
LKKEKEQEEEDRRCSWEQAHPFTDKDWDDLCGNGCYGEEDYDEPSGYAGFESDSD